MKPCPSCAEQIQDDARICRHCGRNVHYNAVPQQAPVDTRTLHTHNRRFLLRLVLFILSLLLVASLVSRWTSPPTTPPASIATVPRQPQAAATPPPNPLGKWTALPGRSSMDDSATVAYALESETTLTGWLNQRFLPILIVRCREGEMDAFVNLGMSANPELGEYQHHHVRVRFDDGAAVRQLWSASTDDNALFAGEPIPFVRALTTSHRLRLEVTPFKMAPQVIDFRTAGLDSVVEKFKTACNWK